MGCWLETFVEADCDTDLDVPTLSLSIDSLKGPVPCLGSLLKPEINGAEESVALFPCPRAPDVCVRGKGDGPEAPPMPPHADDPVVSGILLSTLPPLDSGDDLSADGLLVELAPHDALVCPGNMFEPNLPQAA